MLATVTSDTTITLGGIQISFNLLARVIIVGRIALVFLFVVCAITTLLCLNQYFGLSWKVDTKT